MRVDVEGKTSELETISGGKRGGGEGLTPSGFSKWNREKRLDFLVEQGLLTSEEAEYLRGGGLKDTSVGEKFIENVIGYFQLPLGVAGHFCIDGEDLLIPMAVEETSIVAAASKTAKWIRNQNGYISTRTLGNEIIGQIHLPNLLWSEDPRSSWKRVESLLEAHKTALIHEVHQTVAQSMFQRGGGITDLKLRGIPGRSSRGGESVCADEGRSEQRKGSEGESGSGLGCGGVIHVYMNVLEAMGANIMNQVCEYLKDPIEDLTGERVGICILSNLVDSKLTEAQVVVENVDPEWIDRMEEASLFAWEDPYRAATNNKGVLNGIDAVAVATGNDWRAIEAGVHAYASIQGDGRGGGSGQYRSVTRWRGEGGGSGGRRLVGEFRAPVIVGTVGGVTALHPTARLALKILGHPTAHRLGRILAAVGLVQNLGALRALTTVGIIQGHMALHIRNLALGAGAKEQEAPYVIKRLREILTLKKAISLSQARAVLAELRGI